MITAHRFEGYMLKRFLLCTTFFCSTACLADPLWHCIATSANNAVWNQFGATQAAARSVVDRMCADHNDHKACTVVCFPPRVYWRCMAHDTIPAASDSKNAPQPKQGTWFWTSFSKQVAINGARDACRHNSGYGGCYVDPNACASS